MLPFQFIEDRFRAIYHVAQVVQASWIWTIMTLAEMGSNLASFRAKRDAVDTAETDMLDARHALDGELATYRSNVRAYLRVAKLRYKGQPRKYNLIKELRLTGTGRESALKIGGKVEKRWKKIDQAFVPIPGVTYAATHDCGVLCTQYKDDYSVAETEYRDQVEDTQELAATLDRASIEWYATATTIFPVGSRFGDLIRSMVPTSDRTVQAVEQAVIDEATSPAAGQVYLQFHAPHATSYRLERKGPGDAGWTLVDEEIDALTYLVTGLTVTGDHQFRVTGVNSQGAGPVSAVTTVNVPVAAVA